LTIVDLIPIDEKERQEKLLPGELGVSPSFNNKVPQVWGI